MGQIGFIAQEIETVYPKMVRDDGAGYKSVDYVSLVAPIVTAIQELHASLNNLFHLYMDQEARIRSLEERLEKLESSH
jgi:hypothetical protein